MTRELDESQFSLRCAPNLKHLGQTMVKNSNIRKMGLFINQSMENLKLIINLIKKLDKEYIISLSIWVVAQHCHYSPSMVTGALNMLKNSNFVDTMYVICQSIRSLKLTKNLA